MSSCGFCKRQFENDQGVKGHLRWCRSYLEKKSEQSAVSDGSSLQSTSQGSSDVNNETTPMNPFADLVTQIAQRFTGPDETVLRKQKREAVLTDLCSRLIDWHSLPDGTISQEMAVAAKVAILDELSTLPIEDLSSSELTLRATAIRDRVFRPYVERQREQKKRERDVQQKETRTAETEAAAQRRRTIRKTVLIERGVTRALKIASSEGLTGAALILLEWEVRARLDLLVVGDETEHQVDETMEAAVERPLFELASKKEQAECATRERLLNQCLSVALPLVEATLPWLEAVVIEKVSEKFGLHPSADSTYTESPTSSLYSEEAKPTKPADEAPPRLIRRRQRTPEPPIEMPDHPPTRGGSDTIAAKGQRATG